MEAATWTGPAVEEWKSAYERYLRQLARTCLRVVAPLVVFVFALDGVVERVFRPSLFWWSFWVRIGASVLILGLLALSYRRRSERFAFASITAVLFIVALDAESVIIKSGGLASPFTSAIALLMMGAALFVPYSGRQMMLAVGALWAIYLGPILVVRAPIDAAGAWTQCFLLACATVIAITASRFTSRLREREFMSRQALAEEERKTERLLLNILPATIADRLKANEHDIADGFPEVTILFADIVGCVHADRADRRWNQWRALQRSSLAAPRARPRGDEASRLSLPRAKFPLHSAAQHRSGSV